MTRPRAKPTDPSVMFDADVAAFLGIGKRTLQRRILRHVPGEIDPNDAHPQTIGGRRLWLRDDVERLVGIGEPINDSRRNGGAR